MRPLMGLVQRLGVGLVALPADPLGRIDLDASGKLAREEPLSLVAVCHASNVNGVIQDLRSLRTCLARHLLVDAAQTLGGIGYRRRA